LACSIFLWKNVGYANKILFPISIRPDRIIQFFNARACTLLGDWSENPEAFVSFLQNYRKWEILCCQFQINQNQFTSLQTHRIILAKIRIQTNESGCSMKGMDGEIAAGKERKSKGGAEHKGNRSP
jgi:hypothetical protein